MAKQPRVNPKVVALTDALRPLADAGVTREQANTLVWTSVQAMRQGNSIDYELPTILAGLFPRTAQSLSDDIAHCRQYVYKALVAEMDKRVHTDMEWITREREAVAEAASRWAKQHVYNSPVTVEDVKAIEDRAVGYIDYASKLALYVAEFVVRPDA